MSKQILGKVCRYHLSNTNSSKYINTILSPTKIMLFTHFYSVFKHYISQRNIFLREQIKNKLKTKLKQKQIKNENKYRATIPLVRPLFPYS